MYVKDIVYIKFHKTVRNDKGIVFKLVLWVLGLSVKKF